MKKIRNSVISLLLCIVCAFSLLMISAAAADAIDTSREVKLTIEYTQDNAAVCGVPFDLYYVAAVDENAKFTLTGDFQNYPVQVNGLSTDEWKMLAETLTAYADRDSLTPLDSGTTNERGDLFFPNTCSSLKTGLYLVVGRAFSDEKYSYTTEPFLVSLPYRDAETGAWSYSVIAEAKHTCTDIDDGDSTVQRKVLKIWKDDVKELRPEEVTVQLLKDGTVYDTVTLGDANNWRYSWEELPKYNEDGSLIAWRVVETETEDYTVLISQNGVTFTVTNTYAPDTVTRTAIKVWSDKGYESKRPESITVSLLKDGAVYETVKLSEENSWQYTWNELPRCNNDESEIVWTVREDAVNNYNAGYELKGNAFIITNYYSKSKIPQTGLLWWPVPVLAVLGIAFCSVGAALRKRRNEED